MIPLSCGSISPIVGRSFNHSLVFVRQFCLHYSKDLFLCSYILTTFSITVFSVGMNFKPSVTPAPSIPAKRNAFLIFNQLISIFGTASSEYSEENGYTENLPLADTTRPNQYKM